MTMRELGSDRFRCASQIVQADLNSGPRLRPVQKQFLAWVVLISMLLTPLSVPAQGSSNGAVVAATGVIEVIQIDNFDTGETRTEYFVKDFGTGTLFKLRGGEQLAGSVLSGALVRVSGRLGAMRNGVQELIILKDKSAQIEVLGVGTFAMSGERRAVVLVVDFLDATAACSMTQIENGMYAGSQSVAGLFQDSSFNQLSFPGDVDADGSYDVFGPFTIDFIAGSCDAYYSWAEAADVAATAAGIDLSQYQHKIYVFPRYSELGCEYAGRGNLGCARGCRSWILECESPMVYAHELGHNLGMHHAADSTWDYGDYSDPMGVSRAWHGFNAPHRDQMGWYDSSPESVIEVEAAGTYDVHALDLHPDDAGGPQVLKIWNPGTLDYYYLSFRRAAGYDGYLGDPYADRLNVHRYACCDSTPTYFVASLGDGETFEDAANEFRVTQLDRAGDVVTIQISFGGDSDADGVDDSVDNCPFDVNPAQTDTDGDTLGDVCDTDDDNDGVEDTSDNCPVDANPGQEDLDADDVGDPCDGDDDGDLILDNVDNCPFSSNPSQEDNGGIGSGPPDGIGDACQCGDVTGDGVVNSFDATMIKRQALGLAAPLFDVPGNCDVTDDGACDSFDATVIIRTALGLSVPPLLQSCPNFVGAP